MKQAVINYGTGYNDIDRHQYIKKVTKNLLAGAKSVFEASRDLGFEYKDEKVIEAGKRIIMLTKLNDKKNSELDILNDKIVSDLRLLYKNQTFQKTLEHSHIYQLDDTWIEFMNKLSGYPSKWGGPNWVPNNEDILLTRTVTTGFNNIEVLMDKKLFRLIDVGGQRTERNKWMKIFRNIDAIIFVASLSEYNQSLYEDHTVNRLVESLDLFRNYSGKPEFKDSSFMLFFNKFDLLQKKYYDNGVPLVKPELESDIPEPPTREEEKDRKCEKALAWFNILYFSQSRRKSSEIYPHITTAIDGSNIRFVLQSCIDFILRRHLLDVGLFGNQSSNLGFQRVEE